MPLRTFLLGHEGQSFLCNQRQKGEGFCRNGPGPFPTDRGPASAGARADGRGEAKSAGRPRAHRSSKSSDELHASVSSPTSVPRLAYGPSVHIHCAPNGSTQVSTPGGALAFSSPLWRSDLIGLLGPVCRECPKLL